MTAVRAWAPPAAATLVGLVLAVVALGAVIAPAPAAGHASSQIPHARWSASGDTAQMHLTAAADDLADIVVAAGIWDEAIMWAFVEADLERLPSASQIAALADEPALHEYLLARVELVQDARPCDARVRIGTDFISEGAHYEFTCDEPLTTARIEVRVLHDQNAAYRVISVDGTEQFAIHTRARAEHTWDFTRADAGGTPWSLLAGGGASLLVLAAIGALVLRRPGAR